MEKLYLSCESGRIVYRSICVLANIEAIGTKPVLCDLEGETTYAVVIDSYLYLWKA